MGFFGNVTPHGFYSLILEINLMNAIALLLPRPSMDSWPEQSVKATPSRA
jgi:hypothetical protein